MKIRTFLVPIACLSTALPAMADIFVMKDGSRLEGRIVSQTDNSYNLEIQITKSIRDEKTFPKSEVTEIIAEKLDETAFESLKGLIPTPDFISADEFARRIAVISKFVNDYPKSAKITEAQGIVSILKAEAEVVANGGIKFEGKMITGQEYQADLYDIDAKILERRIREAAGRGDILGALRGLARMDLDFKSTNSRTVLQPLKKQLMRSYKSQIDEQIASYKSRVEERDASLARMSGATRSGTEQAQKEEVEQATARFHADEKSEQVWVTTHPFVLESLENASDTITQEMVEDDFKPSGDAGRIYRNILKFTAKNDDVNAIREAVAQAEQVQIPEKYINNLKAAASAKGVTF